MWKDTAGNKTAPSLTTDGKTTTTDATRSTTVTTFHLPGEPEALRMDQAKLIKTETRDPRTAVPHQKLASTQDNRRTNHREGHNQQNHHGRGWAQDTHHNLGCEGGNQQCNQVGTQYLCPNMTAGCSWKSPDNNEMPGNLAQEYTQWLWRICQAVRQQ